MERWRLWPDDGRPASSRSRAVFLGVERSATGRAWRDRLDARGRRGRWQSRSATACRNCWRACWPAAGSRRRGRGLSRSHHPAADARSAYAHRMEAAAARLADAVERGEQRRHFRRLRRRRRHCFGAARAFSAAMRARSDRAYPGPHLRGLWAERRGHPLLRRARRDAAGHRRLRHHQPGAAGRSKEARPRHGGDRSSSGRRGAAAGVGDRQSEPRRRSVRPRPSRRRRARLSWRWSRSAANCAGAASGRRAASPTCCRCCIWSRSAPSPTWCRSPASTAPSSPRV